MDIPVPWNDDVAVVDEGLWSMLSNAPTEKMPSFRQAGTTRPSSLNL